jgi:hypothetical protein
MFDGFGSEQIAPLNKSALVALRRPPCERDTATP